MTHVIYALKCPRTLISDRRKEWHRKHPEWGHSEETKRRIAATSTGRSWQKSASGEKLAEWKSNVGKSGRGKIRSSEFRSKVSRGLKRAYAEGRR